MNAADQIINPEELTIEFLKTLIDTKGTDEQTSEYKSRTVQNVFLYRLEDPELESPSRLFNPGPYTRICRKILVGKESLFDFHMQKIEHIKDPMSDGLFIDADTTHMNFLFAYDEDNILSTFTKSDLAKMFILGMQVKEVELKSALIGKSKSQYCFKLDDVVSIADVTEEIKTLLLE